MSTLSISTFNVWHGLAGRGPLWGALGFREFETAQERNERWQLALRELIAIEPDIALFQELNPNVEKGKDLIQALGGQFFGRVDQGGIKFFRHGFPGNLATGLGTLIRGRVRLGRRTNRPADLSALGHFPEFRKLSGGLGFSGESFSFHFNEQRYAQFVSTQHESRGRILIVNTHLHHGFERFPHLLRILSEAIDQNKMSRDEVDRVLEQLDLARDRRLVETDRILEILDQLKSSFDGILVGGDFNSGPDGIALRAFQLAGFIDLAADVGIVAPTWDPERNRRNHDIQDQLGFDYPISHFGNPEILKAFRSFDREPRRIDYLLGSGSLKQADHVRLFGLPNAEGCAPSDHFGLLAQWEK